MTAFSAALAPPAPSPDHDVPSVSPAPARAPAPAGGQDEAVWQTFCDLCEENGEPYGEGRGFQLRRCPRCSLLWSNPLAHGSLGQGEDDAYWAEEVYLANAEPQKVRFREELTLYLEHAVESGPWPGIGPGARSGRPLKVLEVGSGMGFFLDVCAESGIEAEGCDISPAAVRHANRERPRSRLGPLDASYASQSFDAVFAFNLIEHLLHPREFLWQAHRVLRPGGILFLETPVQESLMHRMARLGAFLTGGRLNFYGLTPGGHIYKFSRRTFETAAGALGFRCLHQRNIGSPFGELWGKSVIADMDHRALYRLALPAAWLVAHLLGQGNRIVTLLQRPLVEEAAPSPPRPRPLGPL